jgi:hypothetical protein
MNWLGLRLWVGIAVGSWLASPTNALAVGKKIDPTPEQYVAHFKRAKLVPVGELKIDSVAVDCGELPTVLDPGLDDYTASFAKFVIINPKLLKKQPTVVALWAYSVACGYTHLGYKPVEADCWAVQRGRRIGWLSSAGLEQVCKFIEPSKGSADHPRGNERCVRMRQCFKRHEPGVVLDTLPQGQGEGR